MNSDAGISPHKKLKEIQEKFDLSNLRQTPLWKTVAKMSCESQRKLETTINSSIYEKLHNMPILDTMIYPLKEALLLALDERKRAFVETDVAIGVSPDFEINAYIIKVEPPYYGYVILINVGIMLLSYELIKLGIALGNRRIKEDEFKTKVNNLFHIFVRKKQIYNTGFPLNTKEEIELLSHLIDGVELAILAHEFSHFNKGHFVNASKIRIKLFKEKFNLLSFKQNQEKEADIGALELILKSNMIPIQFRNKFVPLYSSSSIILFMILELLERIQGLKFVEHPSATTRKGYVIDFLKYDCNIEFESLAIVKKIEKCFDVILNELH